MGDVVVGQDLVDDPPRLLDTVLAREQQTLAVDRVAEQPLVRTHLVGVLVEEEQLALLTDHRLAGNLRPCADPDRDLRVEPEPQVVGLAELGLGVREDLLRRRLQLDEHLGDVLGELLAGPDVPRHAGPAPRVDVQPHRRERLDVRVGRDARLVAVALELPAHEIRRLIVCTAVNTRSFASRSASSPMPSGGSIASSATTWKRWFCTTSRSAPTSS